MLIERPEAAAAHILGMLAEFCPNRARPSGECSPGQIWQKLRRMRSNSGRLRPNLAPTRPSVVRFRPLRHTWCNSDEHAQIWPDVCPMSTGCVQTLRSIDPKMRRVRPMFDRCHPLSPKAGSDSANLCPNWADFGQNSGHPRRRGDSYLGTLIEKRRAGLFWKKAQRGGTKRGASLIVTGPRSSESRSSHRFA